MNRIFSLRNVAFLVIAFGMLGLASQASAQVRPHYARGVAQFVSPTDFVGSGNATHLGSYTEIGSVLFSPTGDPFVLRVDARVIYTAANGDRLRAVVTGQLNRMTGVITATVTYVGGTGRFANATGTSSLSGQLHPSGAISVAVDGSIDY